MKYPKINTLWKRDEKGKIIEGELSCPEFDNICNWYVTEKIDGTNIRIHYARDNIENWSAVEFLGRTDKAEIPNHLKEYLEKTFTIENIEKAFFYKDSLPCEITIYGEGYGNKINNGQNKYRKDVSFICFDIVIDFYWQEPEVMKKICKKLNIDYVPEIDLEEWREGEILKNDVDVIESKVLRGFPSAIGLNKNIQAEGVVVRTKPLMLFRDGTPIKWKLKTKDYKHLRKD